MRISIILVSVAITAAALLTLLNWGENKMIREHMTIEINRDPSTVFEVLTDVKKLPLWVDGLKEIQTVKQTDEMIGTRDRLITTSGTFESEITIYDPPRAFGTAAYMKGLPGHLKYTLEPTPTGTKVTMETEFKPESLVFKLMKPLIQWKLNKDRPAQMQKFKEVVEQA